LALVVSIAGACTSDEETPGAAGTSAETAPQDDRGRTLVDPTKGPPSGGPAEGAVATVADKDERRTATGTAPSYVEIESVRVAGSADALTLTMRFRGPVPERMPDARSILRVSFKVTTATGHAFMFDAQCVADGWSTSASGGPEGSPVPALLLDADRGIVTLQVDPGYIGGPQPFEWISTVSWSGRDGDYAFDVVPTTGTERYPPS
jgi:hypothetical protein